jgi:hypothetical protein
VIGELSSELFTAGGTIAYGSSIDEVATMIPRQSPRVNHKWNACDAAMAQQLTAS